MPANEAKFRVGVETGGATPGREAAAGLEAMRASIVTGTAKIREMSASLRLLRGTSADVKTAKSELKAKIDAERDALSASSLEILKQGSSYGKLADEAKKAASSTVTGSDAIKEIGGPVSTLTGRFEMLTKYLGSANLGSVLLAGGMAILAAGVAAAGAAIVGASVSLAKWIVETGDAARTMNLLRQGAAGSAEWAKNLGTQINDVASRVPLATEKIQEMGIALERTRMTGPAIVDSLNAIAQGTAAMGDSYGKTIEDVLTRGARWNRFRLQPLELDENATAFKAVAGNLSKQLGIGITEAQLRLRTGRVTLEQGAKAMRTAMEAQFGKINGGLLLGLNAQIQTTRRYLTGLVGDVDLTPILTGFSTWAKLLDATDDNATVTGVALKQIVTIVGQGMTKAFQVVAPVATLLFKRLVIAALEVTVTLLKIGIMLKETFSGTNTTGINAVALAMGTIRVATTGLLFVLTSIATVAATTYSVLSDLASPFIAAYDAAKKLYGLVSNPPGTRAGGGLPGVATGGRSLGLPAATTPGSVVVAPANADGGVVGRPAPGEYFASVAPGERIVPRGSGEGAGRSMGSITLNFTVQVSGSDGQKIGDDVKKSGVIEELLHVLEGFANGQGIPTRMVVG